MAVNLSSLLVCCSGPKADLAAVIKTGNVKALRALLYDSFPKDSERLNECFAKEQDKCRCSAFITITNEPWLALFGLIIFCFIYSLIATRCSGKPLSVRKDDVRVDGKPKDTDTLGGNGNTRDEVLKDKPE